MHKYISASIAKFTLIELLAVLAIAALLAGVAMASFSYSSKNTGAAVREVSKILHLARQEAVSSRRDVAVLFPQTENENVDYIALAVVYYDTSNPATFARGTSWFYLPNNSAFKPNSTFPSTSCDVEPQGDIPALTSVPCIVYNPNGSVDATNDLTMLIGSKYRDMSVSDSVYRSAMLANDKHFFELSLRWLTGYVEISQQQ